MYCIRNKNKQEVKSKQINPAKERSQKEKSVFFWFLRVFLSGSRGRGFFEVMTDDWAEYDFGEGGILYEPEEPEDVKKFISFLLILLVERVIPDKPKALTLEKAGKCLKVLGKIWNLSEYPPIGHVENILCGNPDERLMDMEGYVDEYQYLHIEAVDLALTNIKIIPKHFVWLLSADLSGNRLTNLTACPVTKLPNLVALKLNGNRIEDPYLPPMKHLQYLGLNTNRITSLHRIYHPNLETLDLNYNLIRRMNAEDCWKHTKLKQLELRGNQLSTSSGIEYASLVNLYLAQNQITELKGLKVLVNLQRLHLRENSISDLSGFTESNINLKYLNIRKNRIASLEDLKNLSVLKGLKELVLKGNAFNPEREKKKAIEEEYGEEEGEDEEESEKPEEDDEEEEGDEEEEEQMRIQILSYVPTLTRIDKKPVTKDEKLRLKEFLEETDSHSK